MKTKLRTIAVAGALLASPAAAEVYWPDFEDLFDGQLFPTRGDCIAAKNEARRSGQLQDIAWYDPGGYNRRAAKQFTCVEVAEGAWAVVAR